jgi:hypothetical protein
MQLFYMLEVILITTLNLKSALPCLVNHCTETIGTKEQLTAEALEIAGRSDVIIAALVSLLK